MSTPVESSTSQRILQEEILPLLFGDAPTSETPAFVILTAQAGAGAGRAHGWLATEHPGIVALHAPDLAVFHPRFTDPGFTGSIEGQKQLAKVTGEWLQGCIAHARERRHSVVLEGTFRNPDVALATCERFAASGFDTRIVTVAVRPDESLLSTVSRYLRGRLEVRPTRFVTADEHRLTFAGARELIAAAESSTVGRVTVLGRHGQVVFDRPRAGTDPVAGAAQALRAAQSQRMSALESAQWLSELRKVTEYARSLRMLPTQLRESLVSLHEMALRAVVPQLPVPEGSEVVRIQTEKLTADLAGLREAARKVPEPDVAAPAVAVPVPGRGGPSR